MRPAEYWAARTVSGKECASIYRRLWWCVGIRTERTYGANNRVLVRVLVRVLLRAPGVARLSWASAQSNCSASVRYPGKDSTRARAPAPQHAARRHLGTHAVSPQTPVYCAPSPAWLTRTCPGCGPPWTARGVSECASRRRAGATHVAEVVVGDGPLEESVACRAETERSVRESI